MLRFPFVYLYILALPLLCAHILAFSKKKKKEKNEAKKEKRRIKNMYDNILLPIVPVYPFNPFLFSLFFSLSSSIIMYQQHSVVLHVLHVPFIVTVMYAREFYKNDIFMN